MERGQAERSEAGGEVNPRITKDFPELAETQGTRRRTNTIFSLRSLRLSGALLPQKRDTPDFGSLAVERLPPPGHCVCVKAGRYEVQWIAKGRAPMSTIRQVILHPAEDGGYWVEVPSLPGCFSQGETKEEALENIKEAIALYIEDMLAAGEEVPSPEHHPFCMKGTWGNDSCCAT